MRRYARIFVHRAHRLYTFCMENGRLMSSASIHSPGQLYQVSTCTSLDNSLLYSLLKRPVLKQYSRKY